MEYALSPLNGGLNPQTAQIILLFSEIQEIK